MANEITFSILLKVLKNAWWKILIFTVAVAIAVAAVAEFAIPKKYSSSTEFYILNTSVTSEYTTTSLLAAAEYLANDYIEIIKGDRMMNEILNDIAQKGYTHCSPKEIRSMISASTSSDSSIFSITVTNTDKDLAFYICDSIKNHSPQIIKEITRPSYTSNLYRMTTQQDAKGEEVSVYVPISEEDIECVKIIRSPEIAKQHVSPSVFSYTLIAAVLAAVVAYVFFLIRKITDTVIRNEDTANELLNEVVIGDIPHWTAETTDKNTKEEQK